MAWRGAALSHTRASLNFRAASALHGQFNRTFLVGLAGTSNLGLFALLRAGELRDEGRAEFKAASDRVSGRQPIARTFRSDIEVVAFDFPQIRFRNPQRQGDSK
jgi:hypothetical protein